MNNHTRTAVDANINTNAGIGALETEDVGAQAAQHTLRVAVDDTKSFKISNVLLATAGVLAVLFLAWVIYSTITLFLLLFLALLIATAIEPLVTLLRRGPLLNRSAGILIVYTAIFVVVGVIGWLTLPVVFQQVGELGTSVPRTIGEMEKSAATIQDPFMRDQAVTLAGAARSFVDQFQSAAPTDSTKVVQTVTGATLTLAEVFFAVLTIFVVAYYWLSERTLIKRAAMSWFPADRANRIRRVWDDIEVKVGGWVRGQLTLMVIVGALSAVGYFLMGIQFWPALALFIAIAEAIPLVGPYIGTAPAVLVALTQPDGGFGKALMVVGFAIVLQFIEGNILVPRVMKNSVGISPLAVIISILFGATLAGLAGALVAVPLAGAIQVIVADLKAAKESEEKLMAETEAAKQTRQEEGELVVAYPAGEETKTRVEAAKPKSR
jgi:predicted PurR-regulated permease PerM